MAPEISRAPGMDLRGFGSSLRDWLRRESSS